MSAIKLKKDWYKILFFIIYYNKFGVNKLEIKVY